MAEPTAEQKEIERLKAELAARDKADAERAEQEAQAQAAASATVEPNSTTVPGGRYEVNGILVDANGEAIKDKK